MRGKKGKWAEVAHSMRFGDSRDVEDVTEASRLCQAIGTQKNSWGSRRRNLTGGYTVTKMPQNFKIDDKAAMDTAKARESLQTSIRNWMHKHKISGYDRVRILNSVFSGVVEEICASNLES